MPTCPNGHRSQSDDWCDECGLRVTPSAAVPPRPAGPPPSFNPAFPNTAPGAEDLPTVPSEPCPVCGTPREGDAAFCEECRFHFPAGATRPDLPEPPSPPVPPGPGRPPAERTTSGSTRMRRPAEPLTCSGHDDGDFLLSPPSSGRAPSSEQSQLPPSETTRSAPPRPAAPTGSTGGNWTAVVAADRDYHAAMMARSGPEAAELHFPSRFPELHVPLTSDRATIGRRRHATGESPDIDLSRPPEDPGVSHRHAVLVRRADGGWSVIDQDSTNGTTLNGAEDPIAPHRPVDLADGDRVHVGAWTTITLRRDPTPAR